MAKRLKKDVLNQVIKEQESIDINNKIKELRKLGKRANERLKDLENSGKSEKAYAYNNAMDYFNKIGREGKSIRGSSGKPRFKYSQGKMTEEEINRELRHINKFLNSQTSTLSGVKITNKHKKDATVKYAMDKSQIDLSDTQYDKLIKILEFKKVMDKVETYMGSPDKIEKIINANDKQMNEVIRLFNEIDEVPTGELNPIKLKFIEDAEFLNSLFGGTKKIFLGEEMKPFDAVDSDDTKNVMY